VLVPDDRRVDLVHLRALGRAGANFLNLFGALDRLGGVFVLVVIREFAPLVCAIVVAGVAGTAITADLGARKIREELDALQVLGVDPIKSLVVPRFLALMLVTGMFNIYALLFGTFGGVLVTLTNDAPLGARSSRRTSRTRPRTEFLASMVKTTCFGAIIAIVCCYKGLTASGGPQGVGARGQPGGRDRVPGHRDLQLRLHPDAAGDHPELSAVR
jgi:phospholipid/cholesterol/gamma-HCH transport system permease protein